MRILDWKRSLYGLAAVGGPVVQRRLARRWFGMTIGQGRPVAAMLLNIPIFLISLLVWYLVGRIVTYGLFWDPASANESWGGPSLTGAWIVHTFCALGMAVVCFWLLGPLTHRQAVFLVRSPRTRRAELLECRHGQADAPGSYARGDRPGHPADRPQAAHRARTGSGDAPGDRP
jgi:hypothetical protein